jgi:hypothetical protein
MSEPATDVQLPSSPRGLWWLSVAMIALAMTLWAATRWKPVGWFPLGYGAVLGLVGAWLTHWMHEAPRRGRMLGIACLAASGVASSFLLAAEHQLRRDQPQLTGLAAEMVKSHERLTGHSDTTSQSPWQLRVAALREYLHHRYGRQSGFVLAIAMSLEVVAAAFAGWGASRLAGGMAQSREREADG